MNPGRLRHRVRLQQLIGTKGGRGQKLDTWQDVVTLWAEVKPVKADLRYGAAGEYAQVTHTVKIRWRDGVLSGMRFLRGARSFELLAPPIDEREEGRWMICDCVERVARD